MSKNRVHRFGQGYELILFQLVGENVEVRTTNGTYLVPESILQSLGEDQWDRDARARAARVAASMDV